jgi:hypothetical protein
VIHRAHLAELGVGAPHFGPPAYHAPMERVARTRLIGGGILVATGLVWIGQGTALIKSNSFMTGDPFWAWLGLAAVVVGVGLITWSMRARRPGA